jgi:hypothetical protein
VKPEHGLGRNRRRDGSDLRLPPEILPAATPSSAMDPLASIMQSVIAADCMKLIQTRVPEAEYDLLRRTAKAERLTMQDWIRAAIRSGLMPEEVDPDDPIFSAFPLVRGKGPDVDVAERHDELLYGHLG